MLVLDTDHLTEYQKGTSAEAHRLKQRLDGATEPYATTIITVEEIMRGWMAAIRRVHDPRGQIVSYSQLHGNGIQNAVNFSRLATFSEG